MKIIGLVCIGISGFMVGTFIGCLLISESLSEAVLAAGGLATAVIALHLSFRFYKLVAS